MKNITAKNMIISAMIMFAHTCFGMDGEWRLSSDYVRTDNPGLLKHQVIGKGLLISPYHDPASGENYVKQLQFVCGDQKINLGGYQLSEDLIGRTYFGDNHYYVIEKGEEKAFINIQDIDLLYYPKWNDFATADVYDKGDRIDFLTKSADKKIVQSVYGQADIKKVRECLQKRQRFAIEWKNSEGHMPNNVVVTNIEQNCNISWDGWMPSFGDGSDRLGILNFQQPHEITIDLNANKEAELQYKKNKIISRALIVSFVGLMVWRFWDYVVALKDAIKPALSGPRLSRVDAREFFAQSGTGHQIVVK